MMFVLLGLVIVGSIPAALVMALMARREVRRLSDGQSDLARRLAALEGSAPPPVLPIAPRSEAPLSKAPAPEIVPPRVAEMATPRPSEPAAPERPLPDLESRVGSQWLTWVGILTIFCGTAFFLGVDLGTSPLAGLGQVIVGTLVGALFLGAGHGLTRRRQVFLGWGLLGGGVALFYLAAYAAYGFHDLVPAWVVYPFLAVVALVGAGLAVTHDSRMIATLTLAGAYLTPLLLTTDADLTHALFPYLLAVSAGALRLAAARRWALILAGAFLGTLSGMVFWWAKYPHDEHRPAALAAGVVLGALYASVCLLAGSAPRGWNAVRAIVIPVSGLALGIHVAALLPDDRVPVRGLVFSILAAVHLAASHVVARRRASSATVAAHYTGILLAVIAIPLLVDRAAVTVGWVALGGLLAASGLRVERRGHRLAAFAVYLLALFRALALDTVHTLRTPEAFRLVFNEDFLAGVFLVAALVLTGFAYRRKGAVFHSWEGRLFTPLILLAASLFLWKICFETAAFFDARAAVLGRPLYRPMVLTLSLVLALYGGLLILGGFLARYRPIRLHGVAVLALLILKVFVLDLQVLEKGYRVASFVGVGVLFLAISWLYQRERRGS